MSLTTAIVKWTGAFSNNQVCNSTKSNGIYLLTGKLKYERYNQIQYCGITEDYFCNRINEKHHKLSQIKSDTLLILAVMMRVRHPEPIDDAPLDTKRKFVAVLVLLIFVLCFAPFPIQIK